MQRVRTVILELLRHGPRHNQLLSPLTRYLALCGNHSAQTVTLPYEHRPFLSRLRGLRYERSRDDRERQLQELGEQLADLLGDIRSLLAELSSRGEGDELIHLELVLSASELALLPFELSHSAVGFPGEGQPLVLQSRQPLSMTRRVRRVDNPTYLWPSRPRILFAAAAPRGVGEVPFERHLEELRKVVDPWVKSWNEGDEEAYEQRLREHLIVLPRASLSAIEQVCREHRITHVHLLAHGIELEEKDDLSFGLALHEEDGGARLDGVDGARLANALRAFRGSADGGLSIPAVVTLASCDSGHVGSVIGAGASIAHALHEAGVALVVGSQFPLTFEGSVILARELYEHLMWGEDPRFALADLRRQLQTRLPNTHDWASVVAYAALPSDLSTQISAARITQARRSIDAALDHADRAIENADLALRRDSSSAEAVAAQEAPFVEALGKISRARKRFPSLLGEKAGHDGLLAGAEKREAQVLFRARRRLEGQVEKAEELQRLERRALERSMGYYERVFRDDVRRSWAIVQFLVLSEVLPRCRRADRFELWHLARRISGLNVECSGRQETAWAHGSLAELQIVSALVGRGAGMPTREEAAAQAAHHARLLVKVAGAGSFAVYSTRMQWERYAPWFCRRLGGRRGQAAKRLAAVALAQLPEVELDS